MPRIQTLRRAALFVGAAVAAVAAPTASAATSLSYQCQYPPGFMGDATFSVTAFTPEAAFPGGTIGGSEVVFSSNHAYLAKSNLEKYYAGAVKLTGTAKATFKLKESSGFEQPFTVPFTLDSAAPGSGPLGIYGTGKTPQLLLEDSGTAEVSMKAINLLITPRDANGQPVRYSGPDFEIDGPPYTNSDGNPDTFDVNCALKPSTQDTLVSTINVSNVAFESCEFFQDCPVPAPPTDVRVNELTPTSARLAWTRSPSRRFQYQPGFTYVVDVAGQTQSTTGTSVELSGLTPGATYNGTIKTTYGASPGPSEAVPFTFQAPYDGGTAGTPPSAPGTGEITDADITASSILVRWTPSTQPGGPGIQSYRISYGGGAFSETVPGNNSAFLLIGLSSDTQYAVNVVAIDKDGLRSQPLVLNLTTKPAPSTRDLIFTLGGTATLNTLTKGALQVQGGLGGQLTTATGAFLGDLTLGQTQGRLITLGFLPLTAKVGFVSASRTTGQYAGGVLSTSSKVRVKVLEVRLFGAIPVAGGNTCQTKQPSTIALKSEPGFTLEDGGKLSGGFSLSDLNGCGAFNGLVSPLTAGSGNTLAFTASTKNQR